MSDIKMQEIHPYIRHARTFYISGYTNKFKDVAAYDYRLLFITDGSGSIIIKEKEYPIEKNSLFLFPPGTPYSYYPEKSDILNLIAISFDLSFLNIEKTSVPIPPVKYTDFKKENILMPCRVADCPELEDVIYLKSVFQYEKLLTEIIFEYENKLNYYNEKISGMFLGVLTDIIRKNTLTSVSTGENSINDILGIIRKNYEKKLTNTHIGNMLGYHPNSINRLMTTHTGYSLHDYLINYRISTAINLLNTTNLSITEISERVGFGSVTHFSACFKQKTGHSPSAYRKGF